MSLSKDSRECPEEEGQDEPSSLPSQKEQTTEEMLALFREQWKRELRSSPKYNQANNANNVLDKQQQHTYKDGEGREEDYKDKVTFTQAKTLFLNGIEMERSGQLYEAIKFYKRAVQIVPDIEFHLKDYGKSDPRDRASSESSLEGESEEIVHGIETPPDSGDDEEAIKSDLLDYIQKKCNKSRQFCLTEFEQKATHISALPMEIILYIFRWVVSSDLDMRSLEMCSMVCRSFYVCARDSEIWRSACLRAWGVNCGNLPPAYSSWRQMFLDRSRLHFHGCYISKTTYIRHGENSFQDQFYKPCHLVAYYRYLRFFPDGVVLMLTSAEEPSQSVGQLKSINFKSSSILSGHYQLKDDRVSLVVQRQEASRLKQKIKHYRRKDLYNGPTQTCNMELQIRTYHKRSQLIITDYFIFTRTKNGDETTHKLDLITYKFPPLWFSRVKSYTAEAESPLQ